MTEKEKKMNKKKISNMKEVLKERDQEKYEELLELESQSNEKEIPMKFYSEWINLNFDIDPNDKTSLKVHAAIMDYPEQDLLKIFESYYERKVKTKRKVS